MVKWTSAQGKQQHEPIKQALLSGDFGNIFAPGFSTDGFDYSELRSSNERWTEIFSAKQFQQNVKNMILRLIKEHGTATDEAADLGGRGGGGGGIDDEAEDIGIELAGLSLDNPRRVNFPCNIAHHGHVLSNDAYVTLTLVLFPFMAFYASITGRKIRVEQVLDPILYDAKEFIVSNPEYNSLEAGAFVQSFSESGRDFIETEQDRAYPDRIRVFDEWEVDFEPEQNFHPWGSVRAWKEFNSRSGLRVLTLNVVQKRTNHHENNAAYYSQPPQQPFWSPPQQQQQQPFGGFQHQQQQQQQPNFGGHGGSLTPQHSNTSGFQQQQQQHQTPPMQQQQQQQQQYQSPPMQSPPMQSPPVYQTPPVYQSPPVQSPPMQQQQQQQQQPVYQSPPAHSPPQQQQQQQPVQYHVRTQQPRRTLPVRTKKVPPAVDPNLPTPGVPPAAGYPKNMSMSSSFTEETVETVYEEPETPKKIPAKQAGFFRRVGEIMTGNSSSDGSQSAHMKPSPRKYYGQAHQGGYAVTPDTEAETDSSSATL